MLVTSLYELNGKRVALRKWKSDGIGNFVIIGYIESFLDTKGELYAFIKEDNTQSKYNRIMRIERKEYAKWDVLEVYN